MPYYTDAELEAALTPRMYLELFDVHNTGVPDPVMLERVRTRSETHVNSKLQNWFPDLPFPDAAIPPRVKELAIDAAQAFAVILYPRAAAYDGWVLLKYVDTQLREFGEGWARTGNPAHPGEPPTNHGGGHSPGYGRSCRRRPRFLGGLGDW
jgi:hypothetical protein